MIVQMRCTNELIHDEEKQTLNAVVYPDIRSWLFDVFRRTINTPFTDGPYSQCLANTSLPPTIPYFDLVSIDRKMR
jgi:hypothetical protein